MSSFLGTETYAIDHKGRVAIPAAMRRGERGKKPIGIIDAYWDDKGEALCPMATGVSHHISPYGDIEPCPIIQFARETIHDNASIYGKKLENRERYLSALKPLR